MDYKLLKDIIDLAQEFEKSNVAKSGDINDFKYWIASSLKDDKPTKSPPNWEGKENGRSAESVISTLIVHMGRYAKAYSKAAMMGSGFTTQEEFIYLINLKAFGAMSKMELIRKNIQDKPVGMQIINRLLKNGWVKQHASKSDKRSQIINITNKGLEALEEQMDKIRTATRIVTADLDPAEKNELIRLLTKLEAFHKPIFLNGPVTSQSLDEIAEIL